MMPQAFLELGLHISFAGMVTFSNKASTPFVRRGTARSRSTDS